MKYRDTHRIVTPVSRYVSHHDFRYRAAPNVDIQSYAVERVCVLQGAGGHGAGRRRQHVRPAVRHARTLHAGRQRDDSRAARRAPGRSRTRRPLLLPLAARPPHRKGDARQTHVNCRCYQADSRSRSPLSRMCLSPGKLTLICCHQADSH